MERSSFEIKAIAIVPYFAHHDLIASTGNINKSLRNIAQHSLHGSLHQSNECNVTRDKIIHH